LSQILAVAALWDSRCEPASPKARLHGADLFGEIRSIYADTLEVKTRLDLCRVHRKPASTQPSTHHDDGDGDGGEKVHLAEEHFRHSGWDTAGLSTLSARQLSFRQQWLGLDTFLVQITQSLARGYATGP
jgi:hypothetical protein